jgi:hypothetical protein
MVKWKKIAQSVIDYLEVHKYTLYSVFLLFILILEYNNSCSDQLNIQTIDILYMSLINIYY